MGEEVDWDLNAVVRRFTANAAATARISSSAAAVKVKSEDTQLACLASTFKEDGSQNSGDVDFADLMKPRSNGFEELQQLYRPFLISTTNNNRIHQHHTNSSYGHGQRQNRTVNPSPRVLPSAAVFGGFRPPELQIQPRQPQLQLHRQQQQQPPVQSQTPRSRKRKNQQKKSVCHVTAENLSSDLWAWRKYGQKPIKGSPFPRNYYRCSSSKGCGARKQVERSNSDPNMFIVTYTGDHTHPRPTHRNSLAGSTRNKLTSTLQKPAANLDNTSGNNNGDKTISEDVKPAQPSISSLSPTTPLTAPLMSEEPVLSTDDKEVSDDIDDAADCDDMDEDDELDGDDLLIPNLGNMTDDFFVMGFHHELNNNAPNSSAHNFSSAQR